MKIKTLFWKSLFGRIPDTSNIEQQDCKQWKLIFEDKFESAEINRDFWADCYPTGRTHGEMQVYTPQGNHILENGVLNLTAKEEIYTYDEKQKDCKEPRRFEFTSAMLYSKETYSSGKFEIKCKIDPVQGLFPAFWLTSHYNTYESQKYFWEYDIFENLGETPKKIYMTAHWGPTYAKGKFKSKSTSLTGLDFSKDYYIYGLEWYPDKLVWTFNGLVVKELHEGLSPEPQNLIVNLAIGGWAKTPKQNSFPAKLAIDWIRVYQPN